MDVSRLPEPMRRRLEDLAAKPPLEIVRSYLGSYYSDAADLDEVRSIMLQLAQTNIRSHQERLSALEAVIADPPREPGTLARLVAWDANWVLDDESDAGALEFLRDAAQMLREVIEAAPASAERWREWPPSGL
jgi:hypothetical protein